MTIFAYLQVLGLLLQPQKLFSRLHELPWYRNMLYEAISPSIPVQGRILEVGCAAGDLALELAQSGFNICAVDRSAIHCVRHQRLVSGYPQFIQADALALPFLDQSFNCIFAASVLNVIAQPQRLIAELFRVCQHSGYVTVVFPSTKFGTTDAKRLAETLQLSGFAKAAFMSWHYLARKMAPEQVVTLFERSAFRDIQERSLLGGMVIATSGRRHN